MYSSMICGVASVEPPSVITISSGGRVCASRLSSSSRIECSSSLTGMNILTFIEIRDKFSRKGAKTQRSRKGGSNSLCVFFAPLRLCVSLFFLTQHEVLQYQVIHLSSHETTVTVFRCADDGFAAHVEARVDNHRAAGAPAEGLDDVPVKRVRFTRDRLDPRRVVDVRNCRDF